MEAARGGGAGGAGARGGPWGGVRGADVAGGPGPPRGSGKGHVTFEPGALRRAERSGGAVLCVHLRGGGGQQSLESERVTFLPQEPHALWRPEGAGGNERHLLCSQCWARLLNKRETAFGHGLCSVCGGRFPDTMLRRDQMDLNAVCALCAGKKLVREDGRGGPQVSLESQPREQRAQVLMDHLDRRVPLRPTPASRKAPRGKGRGSRKVLVDGEVSLPGAGWESGGCDGEEGAVERRLRPGERFQVPRDVGSWATPKSSGAPIERNEVEWAPDPTLRALRKESESLLALLADMDYAAFEDIRAKVWQSGKLWGELKTELDMAHLDLNASIKKWQPRTGQSHRPANLLDLSEVAVNGRVKEGRVRADSARALHGDGDLDNGELFHTPETPGPRREVGSVGCADPQGEAVDDEDEAIATSELENIYEDEMHGNKTQIADISRLEELEQAEPKSIVRGASGWVTAERVSQMQNFMEDHSTCLRPSNPRTYEDPATSGRGAESPLDILPPDVMSASEITTTLQKWAGSGPKLRLGILGEKESPPKVAPVEPLQVVPEQLPGTAAVSLQASLPTEEMLQAAERKDPVSINMGYDDTKGFARAPERSSGEGEMSDAKPASFGGSQKAAELEVDPPNIPAAEVTDAEDLSSPSAAEPPGSASEPGAEAPQPHLEKDPLRNSAGAPQEAVNGQSASARTTEPADAPEGARLSSLSPSEDGDEKFAVPASKFDGQDPLAALVSVVESHEKYLGGRSSKEAREPVTAREAGPPREAPVVAQGGLGNGNRTKGRVGGIPRATPQPKPENIIQGVVASSGVIKRSIGGRVVDWETLLGDMNRSYIILELKHPICKDATIELRLLDEHTTPARIHITHSALQDGPYRAPVLSGPLAGDLPVVPNSMPVLLSGAFQDEVTVDLGHGLELQRFVRIDFRGCVSPVCAKFHLRALRLRGRAGRNRPPRPSDRTARGLVPSF